MDIINTPQEEAEKVVYAAGAIGDTYSAGNEHLLHQSVPPPTVRDETAAPSPYSGHIQ